MIIFVPLIVIVAIVVVCIFSAILAIPFLLLILLVMFVHWGWHRSLVGAVHYRNRHRAQLSAAAANGDLKARHKIQRINEIAREERRRPSRQLSPRGRAATAIITFVVWIAAITTLFSTHHALAGWIAFVLLAAVIFWFVSLRST